MIDSVQSGKGHLLTVLSNPPTTSGVRTMLRVEAARSVLKFDSVSSVNLFSIATYRTGGISEVGADEADWIVARIAIEAAVKNSNSVLLAYGCQEPAGAARLHFRAQVSWLRHLVLMSNLQTWMIDGRPRHPSRWHRHTFAKYPLLTFAEALPLVLTPNDPLNPSTQK